MRICIIATLSGGTGMLVRELARRLSENGKEVSIINLLPKSYNDFHCDGVTVYPIFPERGNTHFIRASSLIANILRNPIRNQIAYGPEEHSMQHSRLISGGIAEIMKAFPQLIRIIRKTDPEVLHGHGEMAIAYLLALCKSIFRKPAVVTITRTLTLFPFLSLERRQNDKHGILRLIERILLSKIDYWISLNNYTREQLLNAGVRPEKIIRVPYAIKDDFLNANRVRIRELRQLTNADKLVLFWGSGIYRWGLDIFLRSISKVLEKVPDTYFLIAVRGLDSKLQTIAQRLEERTGKIMILNQERSPYPWHISEIVASADVVALPYVLNPMEPPFTLIESMFMGKPVVTTKVGGNTEVVKNFRNGLTIDPEPNQLAEALIYLLRNDEERARIGEHARRYIINNFNWNRSLERIDAVYSSLT